MTVSGRSGRIFKPDEEHYTFGKRVKRKRSSVNLSVSHYTIIMFSGIIAVGTFFLMLPIAQQVPVSLLDAFFTATSATCVTGLMTINVAESFTLFGQVVIMVLIELGAIGIITVSAIFLLMLGKTVSMRNASIIHDTFTASHQINVRKLVLSVVGFLIFFEGIGTLFLTALWTPELGFGEALYQALFHSVSAFCNAGISTFQNGLENYEGNAPVGLVFMLLFIAGGIGFMTIAEAYEQGKGALAARKLKDPPRRPAWSLQIRLVAITTTASIVIGSILLLLFEAGHAHAGMPFHERVVEALFHVSSSRTAGFATIDIADYGNPSLYVLTILMFIGGAPISTGGGIKVTTLAILIGLALSRYRGHAQPHLFNRSVPEEVVSRAISIVFISVTVLGLFVFALLVTETHATIAVADRHDEFLPVLFEAVSAFGTVGLSMGVTPTLSDPGKVLIAVLMLLGRLGPLTIAMAIGTGSEKRRYEYAETELMPG